MHGEREGGREGGREGRTDGRRQGEGGGREGGREGGEGGSEDKREGATEGRVGAGRNRYSKRSIQTENVLKQTEKCAQTDKKFAQDGKFALIKPKREREIKSKLVGGCASGWVDVQEGGWVCKGATLYLS